MQLIETTKPAERTFSLTLTQSEVEHLQRILYEASSIKTRGDGYTKTAYFTGMNPSQFVDALKIKTP